MYFVGRVGGGLDLGLWRRLAHRRSWAWQKHGSYLSYGQRDGPGSGATIHSGGTWPLESAIWWRCDSQQIAVGRDAAHSTAGLPRPVPSKGANDSRSGGLGEYFGVLRRRCGRD